MDLTNEDVADVLALLDSLPYDELDLQTARFRLVLRRTPDGWTQSVQTRSAPNMLDAGAPGVTAAAEPPVAASGPPGSPGSPGAPATAPPGSPGSPGAPATAPPGSPGSPGAPATAPMAHRGGYNRSNGPSGRSGSNADGADEAGAATGAPVGEAVGEAKAGNGGADADGELVAVRAPLPGTFYRAPRPGAAPFVEVGSRVDPGTVVGIVETMKLMNSVTAGVAGAVAEICLGNAEFAAHGATLLRVRAD